MAKDIRDVDTLEDLRVSLSMQLEEKRQSCKSQDDLLQVKQIRTELNDVVDELGAAKNVEAEQFKAKQLQDIRDREKESAEYYKEYIKLLAEIVPALEMLAESLPRANWLAVTMGSNRTTIESSGSKYNAEYGEAEGFTPGGCRGVPDYSITNLLEWLSGDLDSAKAKQAKDDASVEPTLAGGSKVMQSVIKNKAVVDAVATKDVKDASD